MLSSKMLSSIVTFAPRSSLRYGRHGWYCTFLATWFWLSGAGMRRDQILPVQPPNLKKRAFPAKTIVCSRFQAFLAERSHSPPLQPFAATRRWPQVAVPVNWPQVAAPEHSKWETASGCKWPLSTISISNPEAALPAVWQCAFTLLTCLGYPRKVLVT
jgi:hypothetical protein